MSAPQKISLQKGMMTLNRNPPDNFVYRKKKLALSWEKKSCNLVGGNLSPRTWTENHNLFPQQQSCYGVFAQYRFWCVLGELERFREGGH